MKKKCSTWNNIKTQFFRFAVCLAYSVSLAFVPAGSALATPAVVAVGGEAIWGLLVALGLMAGDASTGYTWTCQDPYVNDIFETASPGWTSGLKTPAENFPALQSMYDKIFDKDIYTTDGENYFVSGVPVTSDNIYLRASVVPETVYGLPTNIDIGSHAVNLVKKAGDTWSYAVFTSPASNIGLDYYYFPYYTTSTGAFVFSQSFTFISANNASTRTLSYDFYTKNTRDYTNPAPLRNYLGSPLYPYSPDGYASSDDPSFNSATLVAPVIDYSTVRRVSGTGDYSVSAVTGALLLRTRGIPVASVQGDSSSLDGALVQVKPSNDDDNNGETPPVPVPPNNWELWRSVEDLLKFISSGEVTNGNTDFGQYVNNNYNYVQINVPDEISQNINIGGSLGINGKGDINININEDVSLPSAGDGSGFYNPSAVNVIGALSKDNPVIGTLSGLFSALDPALVGIVSISISLLLVLGLWKLIRG